jgi:hypothetical protein
MMSEGRLANTWSCACNTSRAADAEDTTTTGTWPRRMSMTGPCAAASACSERCGRLPSWWRLPMRGSPRGEGGGRLASGTDGAVFIVVMFAICQVI